MKKRYAFFASMFLLLFMHSSSNGEVSEVSASPNHLVENDGRTRNITLNAKLSSGQILHLSVDFSSGPNADAENFIPKFTVQDNGNGDSNSESSKIQVILPKAFDRIGIYYIKIDEWGSIEVVHQADDRSFIKRFADRLMGAVGSGTRSGTIGESAHDRLDERSKTSSLWLTPMPRNNEDVDGKMLQLKLPSAMMPIWAPDGKSLVCSRWQRDRWVLAAYTASRKGQFSEQWKHIAQTIKGNDGSAAFAPDGNAIAFLRKAPDGKSDIWVLKLTSEGRPKSESKVTSLGRVLEVLGWDKDMGILFEVERDLSNSSKVRQLWSMKDTTGRQLSAGQQNPLLAYYRLFRNTVPQRQTVIYITQNQEAPRSVVYEMKADDNPHKLFNSDDCYYRWPAVSPDGGWLVIDLTCP